MCITKSQHTLLKLQLFLKKYFICYYIETFLPRHNFFDILLAFVSFLQAYYDICFSHILCFCFSILQISVYIYFLLDHLTSLYHFDNNLLLYLVSLLCFSDNKLNHSLFIYNKKNYKTPFLLTKLELLIIVYCIIIAHIPKVNSISTSFNINNSKIIKPIAFCIKSWQPLQQYGSYLKPISLRYQ